MRSEPVGPAWLARLGPRFDGPFGEAYELVVGRLLAARNGEPLNVIAITSAQGGAGVTTTTLHLGVVMARSGHKSLIVDANLRRPHLHDVFAVPQSPGLAEILTGKQKMAEAIRSTSIQGLFLLAAGDIAPLSPALVDPDCLAACVRDLRANHRFVIFDVPSVLKYPDALSIARVADGAVLVVPAAGTSPKTLQEARRRLEGADAKILGAVINSVPQHEAAGLS